MKTEENDKPIVLMGRRNGIQFSPSNISIILKESEEFAFIVNINVFGVRRLTSRMENFGVKSQLSDVVGWMISSLSFDKAFCNRFATIAQLNFPPLTKRRKLLEKTISRKQFVEKNDKIVCLGRLDETASF